ncbi:putative 1-aminocyclopropane-1-carboxylate synthase [Helianthus annuus]|nr:putative 1-aminocyclopropane-1-carboxylate synthase [Helianthus annuus]KAJ0448755.1 putative 1-aminocyclopropane-1-carboxylate synthase [Helianthus annuus]KAJ0637457.1 putative 1-aminocyclopropane-1-carboxylate synthase [Helianthus annuus]KAJ0668903.1 putative 1-aminocyclopropane-1-carboxylate synthase [Helianthus annuus]KAJ0827816.1 putative 1-aminocyclopropane-1-carboxylate synthase [Helianthus annuus]
MAFLAENQTLLSKIATSEQHGENSPYFDGWKAYDQDPFHLTENPNGVIQMGLAENQLSLDLIENWVAKNPKSSICTKDGVSQFKDIANFQDYHGLYEFRKAIANFMGKVRGNKVAFDPDRIVMGGGATGASESLMFCLADPGDGFLVPTPYYPAFDRDLRWRTGVQLAPIICKSSNDFKITQKALESAYENAIASNIRVKGLIIANPSNPLGTTMDKETLQTLMRFINEKNIHLVCDEIYAATIFNTPEFVSISEVLQEMEQDPTNRVNRELVHIIYSLSKDMGLPGFRVGILYSYNDHVVSCARKMSSFGLISSQTQLFLASILSDEEFIDGFLSESSKRLAKRHLTFTQGLEKEGITCLASNAGLFVWMDLRTLLKKPTFDEEMELWRLIITDVKLNVSPGSSFHCDEPGWFRVCFANMDDQTVEIALKRIHVFVNKGRKHDRTTMNNKKRKSFQKNLRLSFSSRLYDEAAMMSPRTIMSPHSPFALSPLVQART